MPSFSPSQSQFPTLTIDTLKFSRASADVAVSRSAANVLGLAAGDAGVFPNGIGQTNSNLHTIPDVAADTICLIAAVQTLTNKTLTDPTIQGTVGAGTGLTLPAVTLGGAVAGGDQAFTNVGDMTFAAGSIVASGSTNGNTLLLRANDTTFITLTTGATDACTLDAITMSGTWLGTATLPALTLGGTITGNSQNITGLGFLGIGLATSGGSLNDTENADIEWHASPHGAAKTWTLRVKASEGTFASPTIIADGTQLLRMFAAPHDGQDYYASGQLILQIDGTPGLGSLPTMFKLRLAPSGSVTAADRLWVTAAGAAFFNESANAQSTSGVTINQGAADDEILSFKSSDVAHGATGLAETDTFAHFGKISAAGGGVLLRGFSDADMAAGNCALLFQAASVNNAPTSKGTGYTALVELWASLVSGTTWANINADGNLLAIRTQIAGANTSVWIVDEDGDTWQNGSVDVVGAYKVAGTQVVGARVVDARIDDAISDVAWGATEAGVLDACRDVLIAHGLSAAA